MTDQEAGRIGAGLVVAGLLGASVGVGWELGAGWGVAMFGALVAFFGMLSVGVSATRGDK